VPDGIAIERILNEVKEVNIMSRPRFKFHRDDIVSFELDSGEVGAGFFHDYNFDGTEAEIHNAPENEFYANKSSQETIFINVDKLRMLKRTLRLISEGKKPEEITIHYGTAGYMPVSE
jgi:hypothetical protein